MGKITRILISAVGGDIGQGVLHSLELSRKRIKTIGLDINPEAAGLYLCDKGYVVPKASEAKVYLRKVATICKRDQVELAFICNEEEQFVIASHLDLLRKSTKTIFVVQQRSVLDMSMDKRATYAFLEEQGIRVPRTAATLREAHALIRAFGFPLVLKSRHGAGSKHLHFIRNEEEFKRFWKDIPEPLLQEYIGNDKEDEYTVGVFLDKNSRSCGSISMLRKMRFGLTWSAIVDAFPDVSCLAIKVAETIKAVGPCNVQLRRDRHNHLCVIEINARISSTTSFRALLGFNEVSASIDYFLYSKRPMFRVQNGFVVRTWGELVVPTVTHLRLMERGTITR